MNRAKSKRSRETNQPFSAAMDVDTPRRWRPSLRFVLLCTMILLVSGGIVGLSLLLPEKRARTTVPVEIPGFGSTTSTSNQNPAIPNPTPWQYDPITNKHFVPTPGHVHWHSGPPPSNPGTANLGASSPTIVPLTGNPAIPNPQPWQYDPLTNKHWNPLPGHVHWHSGSAPPPDQRQ